MKKNLTAPGTLIFCMMLLIGCANEQLITPVYNEDVVASQSADGSHSPDAAKMKADAAGLQAPVAGHIDGRDFTGTLTVMEFTEEAGVMYAQVMLTEVKITGKDHKYLEFILQNETFAIPATVEEISQTVTQGRIARVAATCNVLNINLTGLNTDVLGLIVQVDPVNVVINANDNEVLGNLICTALDTVNSIVDLVGILNQILDLLSL